MSKLKTHKNSRGEDFKEGDEILILDGRGSPEDRTGQPGWVEVDMTSLIGEVAIIAEINHKGSGPNPSRIWILRGGKRYRWCFHPNWVTTASVPLTLTSLLELFKSPL